MPTRRITALNRHIDALRPSHKLALMAALAALAIGVLLGLQAGRAIDRLVAIDGELARIDPARALLEVVRLTQLHRGLSASVLGGQDDAEPQRAARQAEVDQAAQGFSTALEQQVKDTLARDEWQQVTAHWQALAAAVSRRQITAPDSMRRHSDLIQAQLELHDRVLAHVGFALDDRPRALYRVAALLQQAPRLTERVRQAGAHAPVRATSSATTPADEAAAAAAADRMHEPLRELRRSLDMAVAADPTGGLARAIGPAADQALQLTRDLIERAGPAAADGSVESAAAAAAWHGLAAETALWLAGELHARRTALLWQQGLLLGALALLLGLSGWLGLRLGRSIAGTTTTGRALGYDTERRLAELTAVVDSLALQTQALARHAAVQAARAGEQGGGPVPPEGDPSRLEPTATGADRTD